MDTTTIATALVLTPPPVARAEHRHWFGSRFFNQTHQHGVSLALGFSAGVMIYVSFVEILVKARMVLMASPLGPICWSPGHSGGFFRRYGLDRLDRQACAACRKTPMKRVWWRKCIRVKGVEKGIAGEHEDERLTKLKRMGLLTLSGSGYWHPHFPKVWPLLRPRCTSRPCQPLPWP